MPAADYTDIPDSGTRRMRVTCRTCNTQIEIVRLREHLRSAHNLDSASVESAYLAAMMDLRRSRRGRY